jgi:hypothetical protein
MENSELPLVSFGIVFKDGEGEKDEQTGFS